MYSWYTVGYWIVIPSLTNLYSSINTFVMIQWSVLSPTSTFHLLVICHCVYHCLLWTATILVSLSTHEVYYRLNCIGYLYSDSSNSCLIRALIPYYSHLSLLLNHVASVVIFYLFKKIFFYYYYYYFRYRDLKVLTEVACLTCRGRELQMAVYHRCSFS